jgi:hypothetical protein
MKQAIKFGVIVATLAICTMNCAAKKAPPDPKFTSIQNISVLPILDARPGENAKVNLQRLQNSVVWTLKQKHYPVSASDTTGGSGQIDVDDLESANPAVIKKLGPASDRWVMIVLVNDVHSKINYASSITLGIGGSKGNALISGYLFDKQDGSLVWKGKGTGIAGQGGLASLGMTSKGMMNNGALDSAVRTLFSTMPNLPKPNK